MQFALKLIIKHTLFELLCLTDVIWTCYRDIHNARWLGKSVYDEVYTKEFQEDWIHV